MTSLPNTLLTFHSTMSQEEGTNLPQVVKGSLPPGARSTGMTDSSSSSNSTKLTADITVASKQASLAISLAQHVQGSHDGTNSHVNAMPTAVGYGGMVGSNSNSRSINLAEENNTSGPKPASPMVVNNADKSDNGASKLVSLGEGKVDIAGVKGGRDDVAGDRDGVAGSKSKSIKSSSEVGVQVIVKDTDMPTYGGSGKRKGLAKEAVEQRKKMKNMYNTLHSLLPQFPNLADKASIVGEAVDYIKTLECTVQRLEKRKMERVRAQNLGPGSSVATAPLTRHGIPASSTRESTLASMIQNWNTQQAMASSFAQSPLGPAQDWCSSNIVLTTTGNDGIISVCMPRQHGALTKALNVLENFHIDIVTMNISSDLNRTMFHIHARINAAGPHFSRHVMAEDRYKLAVSAMQRWFSN